MALLSCAVVVRCTYDAHRSRKGYNYACRELRRSFVSAMEWSEECGYGRQGARRKLRMMQTLGDSVIAEAGNLAYSQALLWVMAHEIFSVPLMLEAVVFFTPSYCGTQGGR